MDAIRSADLDEAVARNVKKARERAGLSQAEVAKLLTDAGVPGIHQTTIARIESGSRALKLVEALALGRVLGYRVEDMMESRETALLRDELQYLNEQTIQFQRVTHELLSRRIAVAESLDENYPWTTGTQYSKDALRVSPDTFEMLDELVSMNSDPVQIVRYIGEGFRRQLADLAKPPRPFVASRLMDILIDLTARSGSAMPVVDRSVGEDEAFAEVLARFGEPGSDG